MIVIQRLRAVTVARVKSLLFCLAGRARSRRPTNYLNVTKEFAQRIYDIGDLKIARSDLVKHRGEQEKIVATDETNFDRVFSRQ